MAKRWAFGTKKGGGNMEKQAQQQQPVSPLSAIYLSIVELPLSRFIDAAVDGNLAALIKSGYPSEIELMDAWADLQAQYGEALGDGRQRMALNLYKQISRLQTDLFQIGQCIEVLTKYYVKEFADDLNRLTDSRFAFDVRFPEDYDRDLKRASNRSKSIQISIDLKMTQYEAMQSEKDSKGKSTRDGFMMTLIALSNHAHYPIADSITVFEFCTRIKQFNQHMEVLAQQNKKK